MPKVNGSGDAYQSWNSAQASATPKMIFAVDAAGLARAGVGLRHQFLQRLGCFVDFGGHARFPPAAALQ